MKLNLIKTGTNTMKQSMQSWVNFWVRLSLVIKQLLCNMTVKLGSHFSLGSNSHY